MNSDQGEYFGPRFEGQPVNIIQDSQGEAWFKGRDVAERLAYANPSEAIKDHVEAEDVIYEQNARKVGRPSIYVNESGMYSLILGSKKPEAKRFKHWVTSEVLPSNRRDGEYREEKSLYLSTICKIIEKSGSDWDFPAEPDIVRTLSD
jgi:anti-repressor protein